ncbi:kinesin motor domain-containing protein [Ochromonadaceae sp. CCMP2298]|nr:kinesin motor domain-containing protein [Ochromonadaceae sp. CCMP2298]
MSQLPVAQSPRTPRNLSPIGDDNSVCSNNSRPPSQDADGIHVSVRIRPLSSDEYQKGFRPCCQSTGKYTMMISKSENAGSYLKSQAGSLYEYAFDAVFDQASSQLDVYNGSAKPYVCKAVQGENVTIFAYGATGGGKTHTMFGNTKFESTAAGAGAGLIPQAVADLFKLIGTSQEAKKYESFTVLMSYMEVYNEQVCDLLEVENKQLPVREDAEKGIVKVVGLSEHTVSSYDDVLELLMRGQVNRRTEATKANIVSSRSHAILQFSISHHRRTNSGHTTLVESKLSLIDLAGSERASATQNSGIRLQESANINKSLLALANCINALSERTRGKKTNVKYRDSKLTHLLKSSLEGNCNLVMIANVNPSDHTFDDTQRTLQYANRAKNLKVKAGRQAEANLEESFVAREARLKEDNALLREAVTQLEADRAALECQVATQIECAVATQSAAQQVQWQEAEQRLLQALAESLQSLRAARAESDSLREELAAHREQREREQGEQREAEIAAQAQAQVARGFQIQELKENRIENIPGGIIVPDVDIACYSQVAVNIGGTTNMGTLGNMGMGMGKSKRLSTLSSSAQDGHDGSDDESDKRQLIPISPPRKRKRGLISKYLCGTSRK